MFEELYKAFTDIPPWHEWTDKPLFYLFFCIQLTTVTLTIIFLTLAVKKEGFFQWRDRNDSN